MTSTPKPRRKSRSLKGTDRQSFMLENVPRDLIERAIVKCRTQDPPVSLRWQLERLLKTWVDAPQ